MAVANISYCKGTAVAGASDESISRRAIQVTGPVLYNAAGDARLAGNHTITTADKLLIPAEALAAHALIEITMVTGGIYVLTGLDGDTDIAAGGGQYVPEGWSRPLEIGRTPAGEQHTHLLVIEAA